MLPVFCFKTLLKNVQARLFDSRCEKSREKFPAVSACTAVLRSCRNQPHHVTFQLVSKVTEAPSFARALLCADPRAVPVYTHWKPLLPDERLQRYVHVVWSRWSCSLSAQPRHSPRQLPSYSRLYFILLSLLKKVFRQLLRYSFYFLSIPKGNRSLFLFSLFLPFWTGTNNRPFPLHSWCWMSEGGSQRSRNILLEWYVESSSPSLPFFLSAVIDFKDAATIPCLKGNSKRRAKAIRS